MADNLSQMDGIRIGCFLDCELGATCGDVVFYDLIGNIIASIASGDLPLILLNHDAIILSQDYSEINFLMALNRSSSNKSNLPFVA